MKRIYEPYAYSHHPIERCFWRTSVEEPNFPRLERDHRCDVVIIGAGFTGLSAAYHLTRDGYSVALLDAQQPMFGATGRNGGFCCLGGGKASDNRLDRLFGKDERLLYRAAEKEAVTLVSQLFHDLKIEADVQSHGETALAHRPKDAKAFEDELPRIKENYGVDAILHAKEELVQLGFGGCFFGGMTIPIGFGLNPRKYASTVLEATKCQGAAIFGESPVLSVVKNKSGFELSTRQGTVRADKVIFATNGYSSEDLPRWLHSRFMPVQSSIIVTRQLTDEELSAQGWTSDQIAYDTRDLLHYFRLLPNKRFLFGMRGGLFATDEAQSAISKEIRQNFSTLFPKWREVEIEYEWSGLACLSRSQTPYVGKVPEMEGAFAGFAYHGNGVAMGSYSGALLSDLVQEKQPQTPYPATMRTVPPRFPFGRYRRHLMRPLYAYMAWSDK